MTPSIPMDIALLLIQQRVNLFVLQYKKKGLLGKFPSVFIRSYAKASKAMEYDCDCAIFAHPTGVCLGVFTQKYIPLYSVGLTLW